MTMQKRVSSSSSCQPSSQESHERERKKARVTASVDAISLLAEIGLSKFRNGDFAEAERCFCRALSRSDIGFLCSHIQSSIERFRRLGDNPNSAEVQLQEDPTTVSSLSCETTPETKRRVFPLTRQRHEYNEGMQVYNEPLQFLITDHADVISSILLFNLGVTVSRKLQYAIAISWFQQALAKINVTNSANRLIMVKVLHNLGYCFHRLGHNTQAMENYNQALTIVKKFDLGVRHLAASLNCVGVVHCYNHQAERALEMLKESLEAYRSLPGDNSCELATVLNNIGSAYYLRSEYDVALSTYSEALQVRLSKSNYKSIEVAATVFNVGLANHRLGRLDDAMKGYKEFLDIATSQIGSESRDAAIAHTRMAEIYNERRDLNSSIFHFREALRAGRASLGNVHPDIASILNRLGNLCCEAKDLDSAMKYYQEGLEIENMTSNQAHVIITLTNIGKLDFCVTPQITDS